jgi:2-keto-3-deoxy-L-rhamnonate aldolase RhmA
MNELNQKILENRKELKRKLRARELVFGAWTSFSHPQITEIFTQAPFDFVGIDIEHSTISLEQSLNIISMCHANGVTCLPRIASHNMEMIKRLLDSGADGIITPMVENAGQAKQLRDWILYSPKGKRSFGISKAQNFGFEFDSYVQNWNNTGIHVVQIESVEGVENVDKILEDPLVDCAMIGPYDLSGSLGIPGQIEHPKVQEACKKVMLACKKAGKACGTQVIEPSQQTIQAKIDDGFTFIVLASDVFILWKWADKMRGLIHGAKA